MRRFRLALGTVPLTLVLVAATCGCSSHYYEIVLRPEGDAIERQLTCWKQQNSTKILEDFPRDRLEKIASAYSAVPTEKLKQKHSFSGRFVGKMPDDMGGSGTYTRWVCPFGTAAAYMERFGGNDNVAQQIKDRQQAANRLVDLGIGWLEAELAGESKWGDLRRFLDTHVRHDLENLSYMFVVAAGLPQDLATDPPVLGKNAASTVRATTFWIRMLQYLVERGYVQPRDLPSILRSDDSLFLPLIERLVAQKLGMADDAPRPAALAFLVSPEMAKASLDRYLRTTPEFLELERAWREKKSKAADESPHEPAQVLGELFQKAFFEISFEDDTKLNVVLACGEPPTATNGIWDDNKRQIAWKTTQNGNQGLPTFMYAMWSVPIAEAQIKQFGKCVLTGENLYAYVMWYGSLSKKEAIEWDAFLATLQPGGDLPASLKQFRFSDDPPLPTDLSEPKPSSLADEPRRLILTGLSSSDKPNR